MESKRKLIHLRQKAYFEQKLKERLSFLSGRGVEARQIVKDPIAKNLKADIKAVNYRLKRIADYEKIAEDIAKAKADRAAALLKEQEGGKAEKPKKAPAEGKEKKPKPEKKAGPPKEAEGGPRQPGAGASEEGKAPKKAHEKAPAEPTAEAKETK